MEDIMLQLIIIATIITPIVTAIIEVIKRAVSLPKNVIPLLALGVGVVIGFLVAVSFPLDASIAYLLWAGGLAGLASVGLFELGHQRYGKTKE